MIEKKYYLYNFSSNTVATSQAISYPFRFVESYQKSLENKVDAEVDITSFLRKSCGTSGDDLIQLHQHPFVVELFKKFNAVCTSSAPAERLFSYAGKN